MLGHWGRPRTYEFNYFNCARVLHREDLCPTMNKITFIGCSRNIPRGTSRHEKINQHSLIVNSLSWRCVQDSTSIRLVRWLMLRTVIWWSTQKYLLLIFLYEVIFQGTVVDVDVSSVYALLGQYPDCVIFTELGGTSLVRGVMRLLTSIDISWVKPYFTMMVKVCELVFLFRLTYSN